MGVTKILSTASKEFVRQRLTNLPVVILQTVSEKSAIGINPFQGRVQGIQAD
jgi:hypothetical protein